MPRFEVLRASAGTCIVQYMQPPSAEAELVEWARVTRDRDNRIRRALNAGITKHRIHTITGISRATIDRILDKEPVMTTTTQLHGFALVALVASPEDTVRNFVGEFEDDYDIDGLTDAYREAINAGLDGTGIVLRGSDFFSDYPAREDSRELIEAALDAVDLGSLAEQYDRS